MGKPELLEWLAFSIGPLHVGPTVMTTWLLMAMMVVPAWAVTRRLSVESPSRGQSALEGVVLALQGAIGDAAPGHAGRLLPLARKPKGLPPRIVSDGEKVLLDSHNAGDEPFMLAHNCPGVPVVVDRDRVKAGAHAIRKFRADVLILDDGLQYLRLKHRHDIVLVDKTAPFGTGYMLPRGTLREPPKCLRRASYIFLTKSDGDSAEVIRQIERYNPVADIIECRHRPVHFENIHSGERVPLDSFKGKYVGALSGIAVPESFENGCRKLPASAPSDCIGPWNLTQIFFPVALL